MGTLHVLHVVDERLIPQRYAERAAVHPHYVDEAVNQLRRKGHRILALAQEVATAKGVTAAPILISESCPDVASVILRQASELEADLIVLGTHGRRGLTRILMGSDAEAVLRRSRLPVLLVRAPASAGASDNPEEDAVRLSLVPSASQRE
jgi:nucleotide-binding universal stress UspA family protein